MHIDMAIVLDKARSSQIYIWIDSNGSRSRSEEHDRVRKWDGFARIDGSDSIYANRMALPMRAWFFNPKAEMRVETIARREATSTLPGDMR